MSSILTSIPRSTLTSGLTSDFTSGLSEFLSSLTVVDWLVATRQCLLSVWISPETHLVSPT